jgi:hypothetical protein
MNMIIRRQFLAPSTACGFASVVTLLIAADTADAGVRTGGRIELATRNDVNGGAKPGHWGGVKPGQSGRGGGRSRSALFHSAVASERPSGFGVVVAGQTVPG